MSRPDPEKSPYKGIAAGQEKYFENGVKSGTLCRICHHDLRDCVYDEPWGEPTRCYDCDHLIEEDIESAHESIVRCPDCRLLFAPDIPFSPDPVLFSCPCGYSFVIKKIVTDIVLVSPPVICNKKTKEGNND